MFLSKRFCFLLVIAIITVNGAIADTFLLKNGTQIIGSLISESDVEYLIDVYGVSVKIQKSDVVQIIPKNNTGGIIPTIETPPSSMDSSIRTPPTVTDQPVSTSTTIMEQPILPVILGSDKILQVKGVGVRLRKGPSTSFEPAAVLHAKSLLTGIEFAEGWHRVKTLDGIEGWIHPTFVQELRSIPCLVTGNELHIREAAGEIHMSFTRLKRGAVVMKFNEQGNWMQVVYRGTIAGWSHKDYLKPLTDPTLYRPSMRIVNNNDAGNPIILARNPDAPGKQKVQFTLKSSDFVLSGMTKLVIFHKEQSVYNSLQGRSYTSEAITQRESIKSSAAMLADGLPEEAAIQFIAADILTMLGNRTNEGWAFELTVPDTPSITFGFVVQKGANRGVMVLVQ